MWVKAWVYEYFILYSTFYGECSDKTIWADPVISIHTTRYWTKVLPYFLDSCIVSESNSRLQRCSVEWAPLVCSKSYHLSLFEQGLVLLVLVISGLAVTLALLMSTSGDDYSSSIRLWVNWRNISMYLMKWQFFYAFLFEQNFTWLINIWYSELFVRYKN